MFRLHDLNSHRYAFAYDCFTASMLPDDTAFVFASTSTEDRGRHAIWDEALTTWPDRCAEVIVDKSSRYELAFRANGTQSLVALREDALLSARLSLGRSNVLVDI